MDDKTLKMIVRDWIFRACLVVGLPMLAAGWYAMPHETSPSVLQLPPSSADAGRPGPNAPPRHQLDNNITTKPPALSGIVSSFGVNNPPPGSRDSRWDDEDWATVKRRTP